MGDNVNILMKKCVIFVIFVALLSACSSSPATEKKAQKIPETASPEPIQSSVPRGPAKIKHGNWVGYKDMAVLEKNMSIIGSKDMEAWKKHIVQCVIAHECIALEEGKEVFVEGPASGGVVPVRIKGETETWLTLQEAVQ